MWMYWILIIVIWSEHPKTTKAEADYVVKKHGYRIMHSISSFPQKCLFSFLFVCFCFPDITVFTPFRKIPAFPVLINEHWPAERCMLHWRLPNPPNSFLTEGNSLTHDVCIKKLWMPHPSWNEAWSGWQPFPNPCVGSGGGELSGVTSPTVAMGWALGRGQLPGPGLQPEVPLPRYPALPLLATHLGVPGSPIKGALTVTRTYTRPARGHPLHHSSRAYTSL